MDIRGCATDAFSQQIVFTARENATHVPSLDARFNFSADDPRGPMVDARARAHFDLLWNNAIYAGPVFCPKFACYTSARARKRFIRDGARLVSTSRSRLSVIASRKTKKKLLQMESFVIDHAGGVVREAVRDFYPPHREFIKCDDPAAIHSSRGMERLKI